MEAARLRLGGPGSRPSESGTERTVGLFGAPDLTEADADRLRQHLVACGARAFAEGLARCYANRALGRLLEPHVPAALRTELHPIADAVLARRA